MGSMHLGLEKMNKAELSYGLSFIWNGSEAGLAHWSRRYNHLNSEGAV